MSAPAGVHDALVLTLHRPRSWTIEGCRTPLFVCTEMFLELRDIESRRWHMWAMRAKLADMGLPVASLSDFLQHQDIDWIESQSARLAHEWYLDANGDGSIYRGVSLGRCVEYEVKARAVRLLKFSRCVHRLLERHPDAEIYSDFAEGSIEQRLLGQLGIASHRLAVHCSAAGKPPVLALAAFDRHSAIVAQGRKWGLVAMKLLARLLRGFMRADAPLVVVRLAPQSMRMLQHWMVSGRQHNVRFALWMDQLARPRDVLPMVFAGSVVVGRPLKKSPASAGEADLIGPQLATLLSQPRPNLHAASGPHLESLMNDLFREVANASFPAAREAIDDALVVFGQMNAALLVSPSDCVLVTRAWTLVANRLGRTSLVFQHGHLDYTEDENHLTATHSAFWSAVVAKQFQDGMLRPDQTMVTGSPNADACFRQLQGPSGGASRSRRALGTPRILIVTTGNPGVQAYIAETWVCDYIAGVLDALSSRIAGLSISVKLHPGEDRDLYIQHLGRRLPSNAEISERGDLVGMISEADIVISPPSTVVLEARACGAAVILVLVPSVNDRRTTLEQVDGVITVRSYGELPVVIDAVLAGQGHSWVGTAPLSNFFGSVDGNSSGRLLDAVVELAHQSQGARCAEPERRRCESDAIN